MRTLIPPPASGQVRPIGRTGRWLGFGLTRRAIFLVLAGIVLALPAFWHLRAVWFMVAWDLVVLLLVLWEAWRLPRPRQLRVTRTFLDSPQLGLATRVAIEVAIESDQVLQLQITDDLHPALVGAPETYAAEAFARDPARVEQLVWPRERGEFALGLVYLRWRGALGLAERWGAASPAVGAAVGAVEPQVLAADAATDVATGQPRRVQGAPAPQKVRVYPAHELARGDSEFFLMRARQMERQRRQQRLRGGGREFESLREYQPGDELRAVSWTATARRGKVVTRQFMAERSQQVWAVLDAGRLSRTAFELRRGEKVAFVGETEAERDAAHRLTVTQLDQATTAATMLAQVVGQSGDKFGMMAYGTSVQQVLPPGQGPNHLRLLIDLLSATRSEPAESDALLAAARLKQLQRRRGLIVWISELADTAGRPELVTAAVELSRQHLVVLVLLKHPELDKLANELPANRAAMFHAAAATEMEERRRETIAQLERQGVLIVEATAEEIGVRAVSEYLEVKARGLL